MTVSTEYKVPIYAAMKDGVLGKDDITVKADILEVGVIAEPVGSK